MNRPVEPGSGYQPRVRMETGLDVLAQWAECATQCEKNMVYKALFAVLDGSIYRTHITIDDFQRPNEFTILVRKDLVIKIQMACLDSFGVVYIGPRESANPGDLAA